MAIDATIIFPIISGVFVTIQGGCSANLRRTGGRAFATLATFCASSSCGLILFLAMTRGAHTDLSPSLGAAAAPWLVGLALVLVGCVVVNVPFVGLGGAIVGRRKSGDAAKDLEAHRRQGEQGGKDADAGHSDDNAVVVEDDDRWATADAPTTSKAATAFGSSTTSTTATAAADSDSDAARRSSEATTTASAGASSPTLALESDDHKDVGPNNAAAVEELSSDKAAKDVHRACENAQAEVSAIPPPRPPPHEQQLKGWQNLAVVFPAIAGAGLSLQAACNSTLGRTPYGRGFAVLFSLGSSLLLCIPIFIFEQLREPTDYRRVLRETKWYAYFSGVLGFVYVLTITFFSNTLGTANLLGTVIATQVVAAVVIDHFGWVGLPVRRITAQKVVGVVVMVAGVVMMMAFH
ncbi:hypothetical protein DFJ73DRAFT_771993 [Zopfochytrium polystomum]|nr:hypothetical protein DFJ73DRAFT_771993 [Zopfochytrium polystomum]